MKWFITLSLILYAIAMPLQRVQADNSTSLDFGPLASLVGEWQGTGPGWETDDRVISVDRRRHESGGNDDEGSEAGDDDNVPYRQRRPYADSLL